MSTSIPWPAQSWTPMQPMGSPNSTTCYSVNYLNSHYCDSSSPQCCAATSPRQPILWTAFTKVTRRDYSEYWERSAWADSSLSRVYSRPTVNNKLWIINPLIKTQDKLIIAQCPVHHSIPQAELLKKEATHIQVPFFLRACTPATRFTLNTKRSTLAAVPGIASSAATKQRNYGNSNCQQCHEWSWHEPSTRSPALHLILCCWPIHNLDGLDLLDLISHTRSSCTRIHDYMLQTPTGKECGPAACFLDMVVEQLSNSIERTQRRVQSMVDTNIVLT
jgi:hypothetical protein